MRAIGDRHDQPCQEREGLAASLSAHTTTRPQGRLKCHSVAVGVVPDAGIEPARPKATAFEAVAYTSFANRGDPDFWRETGNPQAKPPRRAPTQGVPPGGIEPPSQRLKGARSATELEKHDLPTYPSGRLGSAQGVLVGGEEPLSSFARPWELAHRHRMFMRLSGGGVGFVRVPTNSTRPLVCRGTVRA